MQGGKTIAQVATDRGVAVDKVITAMVDDMKAKVAAALTAGTITQAKADEELADEPKETTDKVNNVNKGRGGKGSHGAGVESGQNAVAAKILSMTDAELKTALEVYIGYLRRKLEDVEGTRVIHTVRGVGYVLRENAP